ncbi:MAG: ferredoxin [Candidatus Bathyarchaeota archaeon]|nr:MAG: ferredoxin [Candidatus Bathyarchaeota archaeon]
MNKFRVEIDKQACQSFGACIELCPEFFKFSDIDSKSSIEGAEKISDKGAVVAERLELEELKCIKEAAEACPFNAIHITNLKTEEHLI